MNSFRELAKKMATCSLLAMAMLCSGKGFTQPSNWQIKKIDSLFSQWDNQTGPGMQLLILKNGKQVFAKGYGLANIDRKKPNSIDGKIWVASMSKQFTALAIAMLADQKQISLDDDIRKYLPELPDLGDTIRIKHLVYHTSGLRDGFVLTAMSFKGENEYTNENVIKYLSKQNGRNFRPGDRFEYNNGGYVLLATIVERVSRGSFSDFIRDRILRPLQMNQSAFYSEFPFRDTSVTVGYSRGGGNSSYVPAWFKGSSYGSTGLITTAKDLAKWDRIFYKPFPGKIVQHLQIARGVLNNGQTIPYAFGLEVENYKGALAITHSGSDPGFKSEMLRLPEQQLTIICLANTEDAYNNTDRLFKVASLFLSPRAQKEVAGAMSCNPAGIYLDTTTLASIRFVEMTTAASIASSNDGYKQPLVPYTRCSFQVKDVETDRYFFDGDNLEYITRASKEQFHRVKQAPVPPGDLQKLAGKYYSEELGVTYNFFERDGTLYLKFFDAYDVPLTSYEGGYYIGEFIGTNVIQFIRDGSNKIVAMHFNREGIRALSFAKQ